MDVVTQGVLDKRGKTNTISKDNSLRKIHSKIRSAYGPFARIWQEIDEATSRDLSVPIKLDLKKIRGYCEQTALMLGQASNAVSYLRRKSLLSNITSEKTSKTLLTSHKKIFEEEDPHNEIIPEGVWDKVSDVSKEVERVVKAVRQENPFRRGSQSRAAGSSGPTNKSTVLHSATSSGSGKSFPPEGKYPTNNYSIIWPAAQTQTSGSPPIAIGGTTRAADSHKTSRTTEILPKSMEVTDERSGHPRHSVRVGDSTDRDTTECRLQFIYPQRGGGTGTAGNPQPAGERSHRGDTAVSGPSVIKSFSQGEEGRLSATDSKSEKFESVYTIHPFQNGESQRGEKPHQGGRLDGENRPQRRIFHTTPTPRLTEVCAVQVEEPNISVHLPLLRPWASTEVVHKTDEGAHVHSKEAGHKTDHLLRRHTDIWILSGGDRNGKGHDAVLARKPGFCHQPGKVSTVTLDCHGISRSGDK